VFEVNALGQLTNLENIEASDDAALNLVGVGALAAAFPGEQPVVFAGGFSSSGISGFAALFNGALLNTANVDDNAGLELLGTGALVSLRIGFDDFIIAAGTSDDGFSSFEVADDGTVTNIDSVDDAEDVNFELNNISALAAARIGTNDFVFAAGFLDDGISVFRMGNSGDVFANPTNVTDAGALELDGVSSLTTAEVGNKTFLFTAASVDDGVSVFQVGATGTLTNVDNVTDADDVNLRLDGANAVTTATISGITLLFVSGRDEDGISVFGVHADGSLEHMTNVSDGGSRELDGVGQLKTVTVNGNTFLFAAGRIDDGVSSFRIDIDDGVTISGTNNSDLVNATTAPVGQFLPSELGDDIFGFGGGDSLFGLAGGDTLTGGLDRDFLTGGTGADLFNFDFITETQKGLLNRDFIEDFTRGEDRIDLFDIDARTGAGNQTFKFIGAQKFHDRKGELHFVKKAGFVLVEGDVNGDGRADFQIQVEDATKLNAADFIV
jgi:6-phosphogluconolactonase (cycloisomerase 2 family)